MPGRHVPASDLAKVAWTKSRRSATIPNCVEAAAFEGGIVVRNSNTPDAGGLTFSTSEWTAFLGGVRDGDFDHLSDNG